MRKSLLLLAFVSGVLLIRLHAKTSGDGEQGYRTAAVVSVQKQETSSNYIGGNPNESSLQSSNYAYAIGVQMNCNVYLGLYQSAINYLPSDFAPNKTIDVRLRKHILYVNLPYSDWDVKMGILSHHRVKDETCPAGS